LRSEARIGHFAIPGIVPIAHSYYMIIIKIKYSYPVKYINTKVHRLLVNTSTYHYKSSIPRNDTICFRGGGIGNRDYGDGGLGGGREIPRSVHIDGLLSGHETTA